MSMKSTESSWKLDFVHVWKIRPGIQDQVGRMFGRVDDEGDGFDDVELTRILSIVSGLPAVSERIKQAAQAGNSWLFDLVLCTVAWRNL